MGVCQLLRAPRLGNALTRIAFTFADKRAAHRWDLSRFGTVLEHDADALRIVVDTEIPWITVRQLRRAVIASGYYGQVEIEEA